MSFIIPAAGTPNNPADVYDRLVETYPEFAHLSEHKPACAFMLRAAEKVKAGRRVLGTCYLPGVQGDLSPMFDWLLQERLGFFPVYLFVLDQGFWEESGPRERDALMFHEMLHTGIALDKYDVPRFNRDTGDPVWTIKAHDIEAFNAEVARFGAWKGDIAAFLKAGAS